MDDMDQCKVCQAKGVKLWREYGSSFTAIRLLCGPCALKDQNVDGPISPDGTVPLKLTIREATTNQIGWFIPAVPTPDNKGYWGYTSVPEDAIEAWRKLPNTIQTESN